MKPAKKRKGYSRYGRQNMTPVESARHVLEIAKTEENGCILSPYPPFDYKRLPYSRVRVGGELVLLHRHIYEQLRGPIRPGFLVLHKCDDPRCINPTHLFLGTHRTNILDRDAKGRANKARGEKNYNARFTAGDIPKIVAAVNSGQSMASIGRQYGVSTTAISAVYAGRTWAHVKR